MLADDTIRLITACLTRGDNVGEVAARIKRLIGRIRSALSSAGHDASTVDRLIDEPASKSRQAVVTGLLAQAIEDSPELEEWLRPMVNDLRVTAKINNAGAVAVGGEVKLSGRYVAGRDLRIGTEAGQDDDRT
jgi:protein involved in polysaccharide export with SLBB domain